MTDTTLTDITDRDAAESEALRAQLADRDRQLTALKAERADMITAWEAFLRPIVSQLVADHLERDADDWIERSAPFERLDRRVDDLESDGPDPESVRDIVRDMIRDGDITVSLDC